MSPADRQVRPTRGRCGPGVRLLGGAFGLCLAGAGLAAGQTPGPNLAGTESFRLTDRRGYLEFVTLQREQNQESKVGAGDESYNESIFQERVNLEVDGYVYHPNLMEFTLGGTFGLLQYDFDADYGGRHRSSGDEGTLTEFDLHADLFKRKSYPGSVFARRHEAIVPRAFLSSLQTTTTNYGVTWQYVSDKLPTSFQFSHTDVLLHPLAGDEEDGRQINTLARFETAYRFSDFNVLSFLFNRESVSQEPFDLNFDTDEATLSHRLGFGDNHKHVLESEFNYYDQTGSFDTSRQRWRETLRLQHTENLRSWYQSELLERQQGNSAGVDPIDENSFLLSATVEHKLYESLVSQFSGFLQRQEFEPSTQVDRTGLFASFDYRKTNRWGVLQANYRARYQTDDRAGLEVRGEVLDEAHTFRDPEPVVLSNPYVESSSILVTAEDRLTAYAVGRDYTLRRIGTQVQLERVPTGHIADGQTVLIDYVFSLGGPYAMDTLGQDFGLRQNFKFGLSPYYRLRWQDQTLTAVRDSGAVAEDITGHILGAEFLRGPFHLQGEYENYDSTINPFDAIRLNADYTHHFKFGATGVLKARWSEYSYQPPVERDTEFFVIEGRYRHPLTRNLTVEAAVLYRTEEDSLSGPDEGLDIDLSLEWLIRETEVRITYEQGQFEDDFARNDNSALYVQVRRRF